MKAFRIGDKVRIVKPRLMDVFDSFMKVDIIENAEYNRSQDTMEYSLLYSGAWFHNENLEFISSDGLKTLRKGRFDTPVRKKIRHTLKVEIKTECFICAYLHPEMTKYYKCCAGDCPAKN
jgi:hypothetical protein